MIRFGFLHSLIRPDEKMLLAELAKLIRLEPNQVFAPRAADRVSTEVRARLRAQIARAEARRAAESSSGAERLIGAVTRLFMRRAA